MILSLLFVTTTQQLNLPPNLLESICYVESKHKITAIHHHDGDSDSLGICQIKYKTAKWLGFKGTPEQLMEPKNNILYAGKYLKYQLLRYNSVNKGIIAYNKGNAKGLTRSSYYDKVMKEYVRRQYAEAENFNR